MAGKAKDGAQKESSGPKGAAATGVANRAESAAETAERHRRVVELRLRGRSWEEIQAETGLAPRTSRGVWAAWAETEKHALVSEDPIEVVLEHIAGLRDLRAKAADVFEEAEGVLIFEKEGGKQVMIGRSPAARVGALRLMMDLRAREIDLRQDTGLLPRNLGKFQVEIDVRYVVEQIAQIMVKYDMPPAAQDELLQLLQREPPAELPAPA